MFPLEMMIKMVVRMVVRVRLMLRMVVRTIVRMMVWMVLNMVVNMLMRMVVLPRLIQERNHAKVGPGMGQELHNKDNEKFSLSYISNVS